jgi:hypothetical protein
MYSIDSFKSILNGLGGPAQDSHYLVYIVPPASISGLSGLLEGTPISKTVSGVSLLTNMANGFMVSLMAQSAQIPGKRFMTVPFTMYGTEIKMPYGVVYEPLNLTFTCTNSMAERKFFDMWHRMMTDPTHNYWQYYDNYTSDIYVIKLPPGIQVGNTAATATQALESALEFVGTQVNNIKDIASGVSDVAMSSLGLYMVRIEEAYPIALAGQQLQHAGNSILTFDVEFAYRRYRTLEDILSRGSSTPGTGADDFLKGWDPRVSEKTVGNIDTVGDFLGDLAKKAGI